MPLWLVGYHSLRSVQRLLCRPFRDRSGYDLDLYYRRVCASHFSIGGTAESVHERSRHSRISHDDDILDEYIGPCDALFSDICAIKRCGGGHGYSNLASTGVFDYASQRGAHNRPLRGFQYLVKPACPRVHCFDFLEFCQCANAGGWPLPKHDRWNVGDDCLRDSCLIWDQCADPFSPCLLPQ